MSLAIVSMHRRVALFATGILWLTGAVASIQAQPLAPTTWTETLSAFADDTFDGRIGMDDLAPENLLLDASGSSWAITGDVTFATSGPPSLTTSLEGSLQSGVSAYFGGTSYVYVTFEFRVRQTATPPVAVGSVPVTVHSRGSATATGDAELPAAAFAYLLLSEPFAGSLVGFEASATNDPEGSSSDSYDRTESFLIAPGTVVSGEMSASAGIGAEIIVLGHSSSATAFIDPVIEVADETIPGTSSIYSDYFDIEFGAGFFIGNPAAVQQKTWGQVKALYGTRR